MSAPVSDGDGARMSARTVASPPRHALRSQRRRSPALALADALAHRATTVAVERAPLAGRALLIAVGAVAVLLPVATR